MLRYCTQSARNLGSQKGSPDRLIPVPDRSRSPLLRIYACREIFHPSPVLPNLLRQQKICHNPLGRFPLLLGLSRFPRSCDLRCRDKCSLRLDSLPQLGRVHLTRRLIVSCKIGVRGIEWPCRGQWTGPLFSSQINLLADGEYLIHNP